MCKHGNVFSLPVLRDESLTALIRYFPPLMRSRNRRLPSQGTMTAKNHHLPIRPNHAFAEPETARGRLPGDHIGKETPVPIPNTVVKLSEPMIVPTSVKVGIAGI